MIGRVLLASLLVVEVASAQAGPRQVMVVSAVAPRTPTVDAAIGALVRGGAQGVATEVTAGDGSLADSAFIVGCDPVADACRDAVARQLGIDALWVVAANGATVVVTVRPVGGPTSTRRIPMSQPAEPAAIAALEATGRTLAGGEERPAAGASGELASGELAPAVASRPTPVGAIGLGIGGGVLLLGGAVMWGLAASTQGDIDAAPTDTADQLRHLAALEDTGRSYAGLGNGMVVGGAVAVVAAGAWIYWLRRRGGAETRVAPAVGGGVAGLTLEGTW